MILIGFSQANEMNLSLNKKDSNSSSSSSFDYRFEINQSSTTSGVLKRDKRFLVFTGGGVVKVNKL